jgi:ectoine hydroxylase-related dioxygenase (phytanoyl-CoA dioxygenase family)
MMASAAAVTFQRDGYYHAKGLLDSKEIGGFREAVDRAVAFRTRDDGRTLEERTPFEQSFTMCQYLWEDFPEVGALTFHPAVAGMAARLLGAPAVRLWHDQALYKEAHARETEMHQDHPYWPIAEYDAVTAWIPLVEIDEAMGCMGYVPGSHTGEVEFIDVFRTPGQGREFEARQTVAARYVPCRPGDVIYHHGRTIHRAMPNTTDEVRRVHTAIYFRDGCTRADARPHPSLDRGGVPVGAKIDSGATPIAWPLPGRRLPTPIAFADTGAHSKVLGHATKIGIFPNGRR